MRHTTSVEQKIIDLLSHLQLLVRGPTWSLRREEMRTLVAELAACWDLYRQHSELKGQPQR